MPTGIVHDLRCTGHRLPDGMSHVERPARSLAIWDQLLKAGIVNNCIRVATREATLSELRTCHSEWHIRSVLNFAVGPDAPLYRMLDPDTYVAEGSASAALLAAGGLIELCDKVASGSISNGISILRPPGHHAGLDGASGFCLFNNVAIAAKSIQKRHLHIGRILIFDWDVHHGNGTEEIFYEDDSVLFMSIHRGFGFYPCSGAANDVGDNVGQGFTVNVPLPASDLGDDSYLTVMKEIFLPIAIEFAPDLIIVSAGFDAARGDPLGGMAVSPFGFAKMTAVLSGIQQRIVLALEGGYNLDAISACATACVRVLTNGEESLNDDNNAESSECFEVMQIITDVKKAHTPFWSCFSSLDDDFAAVDAQAALLLDQIQAMMSNSKFRSETESEFTRATELDDGVASADESLANDPNV